MKAPLIWKRLLIERKKIATSKEIRTLAREIGRKEWRSVKYLQTQGYIVRILRGIFYVRSVEEQAMKKNDVSLYEMVAMALKEKGIRNWYFGMETGLKFNMMTHEYYMIDYVITDSFRTTKVIKILNTDFKFIKRGKKHFSWGIVKDGKIRYSDNERTVLDIAYRDFLKKKKREIYTGHCKEYENQLDNRTVRRYLKSYPGRFRENIEGQL